MLIGAVGYLVFEDLLGAGFAPIALSVAVAALLGGVMEIAVIRHLYREPIAAVLATFGVGLVIAELVRLALGSTPRGAEAPIEGVARLGSYQVAEWRLWIVGLALIAVLGTFALVERTPVGLKMRATLQDARLARASGLPTARIYTLTFMLGTALAAFAGALLAPLTTVFPGLGDSYLVLSFLAVMVGGPGTFLGPILGAVLLGAAGVSLTRVMSPTYAQVAVVLGAVAVMRLRPHGLLGARVST
jgi:branched-chain amino acid transport system permease protein